MKHKGEQYQIIDNSNNIQKGVTSSDSQKKIKKSTPFFKRSDLFFVFTSLPVWMIGGYMLRNTAVPKTVISNLNNVNLHLSLFPHIFKALYHGIDKVPVLSSVQKFLTPTSNTALGLYAGFLSSYAIFAVRYSLIYGYYEYNTNKPIYSTNDFVTATFMNIASAGLLVGAACLISKYTELDYYYTTLACATILGITERFDKNFTTASITPDEWKNKDKPVYNSLYTGRINAITSKYNDTAILVVEIIYRWIPQLRAVK